MTTLTSDCYYYALNQNYILMLSNRDDQWRFIVPFGMPDGMVKLHNIFEKSTVEMCLIIMIYIVITIIFAQGQDETVHIPQQHDQLCHSVGVQDKPGTTARSCWPCQAWLCLPSLQPCPIPEVGAVCLFHDFEE